MLESILMSLAPGDLCTEYDVVHALAKVLQATGLDKECMLKQGMCAPLKKALNRVRTEHGKRRFLFTESPV
jgi:hypothetical protein